MAQPTETTKMGQRGAVVIPAQIRRLFNLDTGSLLIAEATPDGILLKPAVAVPISQGTKPKDLSGRASGQ